MTESNITRRLLSVQLMIDKLNEAYTVDDMTDAELRWLYEYLLELKQTYGASHLPVLQGRLKAAVGKYVVEEFNITSK